jgi:hypothetical protein
MGDESSKLLYPLGTLPGTGSLAPNTDLDALCTNITRMWIIASI